MGGGLVGRRAVLPIGHDSAAWAVLLDVGRRNAEVVTGFMNSFGNLGGALAPIVVGYVVERFNPWALPFYVMAGVFAFGVMMWLLVDPQRSVLENELAA